MTRVGWLTDIHLVFLRDRSSKVFDPEFYEFTARIRARELDALFITGDISEGTELLVHLELLDQDALESLWHECNAHGWFALRRSLLDGLVEVTWTRARAMKELDGVGKDHEEFKLRLEKDKAIEIAAIDTVLPGIDRPASMHRRGDR